MLYTAGSDVTNSQPGLSSGFSVKAPFSKPKPPTPPRTPQSSIRSAREASSPYTPRRAPIPNAFKNVPGRTIYSVQPTPQKVEPTPETKPWVTWDYCMENYRAATDDGVFKPRYDTVMHSLVAVTQLIQDFRDLRVNVDLKLREAAVRAVSMGFFEKERIVDAEVDNLKKSLHDAESMLEKLEKRKYAIDEARKVYEEKNWYQLYLKSEDEPL